MYAAFSVCTERCMYIHTGCRPRGHVRSASTLPARLYGTLTPDDQFVTTDRHRPNARGLQSGHAAQRAVARR